MKLNFPTAASEIDSLNEIAWASQFTDPAVSHELANRCASLARQSGHAAGLAYALLNRAFYEVRFCPTVQSDATLRDAEARFAALGDRRGLLLAQSGRAGVLLKRNEFDAAEALLEQVMQAPEEERQPADAYFALYRLGYVHFHRGQVQEGLRYYYKALALVQRERSMPLSCHALSDLGSAQMELANYEEARDLLEQAHLISKTMPVCFAHLIVANLASVHLEMGDAAAALQLVENDFPLTDQFFQPGDRAFLLVVAAQTYASLSRWREAEVLALQALKRSRADNHLEITNQCLWMLGVIARGMGQHAAAIDWLLEAERGFGEIHNVFYVLHVYRALADAYADVESFGKAFHFLQLYQKRYEESLGASAKARFFTLQIQHELTQAEFERDFAMQQKIALETLNVELHRKVEEVEKLQTALRDQAVRDPLTGLYNRRFLAEQIGPILDQAQRTGYPVCIVLLDLDYFKRINDTHGHGFGDQVLIELAELLRQHTRSSDLAVRYGGEEFCLVFPVATAADTRGRTERLLKLFHNRAIALCEKSVIGLTFSAGIAEFPLHGATPDELLQNADAALYRAKDEGRNRVLLAG